MQGEWMIGKFAKALALLSFTLFVLPNLFSQAAPAPQAPPAPTANGQQSAAQEPATPVPSDQESTTAEVSSSRRKKPKDYKNWQYNVGAGANVDSGTTKTFVRGGGIVGTAGVARNANKYLGLRVDFIFADLPLRQSSLSLAQAGSASSYLFAGTIDPIINVPVSKLWGGYILLGPGYYHRSGTLNSDTAVPGSSCNPFFEWWAPART
jgi:nitrogen fixation protein